MSKIYVNQTALRITAKTFTELEGIEKAVIKYQKPNRDIGEFNASIGDVEKGVIFHECIEGEIDVSGWWVFWAFITFADGRSAAGEAEKIFIWQEGR